MERVKLTLIFMILTLTLSAQTVTKSYNVDLKSESIGTLFIYNQYGSVTVNTVPSTSSLVQIIVKKSITGMEDSRAEKYLEKIKMLQSREGEIYSIKTSILADLSTIPEINIDYTIKIPADKRLDLKADFCDVDIDSIVDVTVDINSSTLKIGEVSGIANIMRLTNSKATIKNIDTANLYGKNSSVLVETSNSLKLEGEYFVAKIDTSLVTLDIELEFGGVISEISNNILGTIRSGKVQIANIPSILDLIADSCKVEIKNGSGLSYTFECHGIDGRFLTPNSQLTGVVGDNPISSIKISANQGEVKIL